MQVQRARVAVHPREGRGESGAAGVRLQAQHGGQGLREVQAVPLRPALGTSDGARRQRMQRFVTFSTTSHALYFSEESPNF